MKRMATEKTGFEWIKSIGKTQKSILITVILGIIASVASFAYNTISLPEANARLLILEKYIDNDKVDKAILKNDVKNIVNTVDKFAKHTDEQFDRLSDKMDENNRMMNENNRIVKIVKENTK